MNDIKRPLEEMRFLGICMGFLMLLMLILGGFKLL